MRLLSKKIIDKRENGRIKIITGIRRCEKTYLLFNLYQKYYIFIDEIQLSIAVCNPYVYSKEKNVLYTISFECRQYREKRARNCIIKKIDDSFKKIVIARKQIIPKHYNDGILYIGVKDFCLMKQL